MNFVFCTSKSTLPKYVTGTKPHTINTAKMTSVLNSKTGSKNENSYAFMLNMMMSEEFKVAWKKKKSCIIYINPDLTPEVIRNVKKHLNSMEIEIKKFYLVDDGSLKKVHGMFEKVFEKK